MYLAIIGDIKRSRIVDNRAMTQRALVKVLNEINERFSEYLLCPLVLSQGDEFQGLLRRGDDAVALLDEFDRESHLLNFRFGLGWGAVDTDWSERSTEMDGSCFHAARKAIDRSKRENRWATFSSAGLDDEADSMVNGVLEIIQMIREGWTDRQKSAVSLRRMRPTQDATARDMGFSQPTLSKMLKAARYPQLLNAEETLRIIMRRNFRPPPREGET